MRISLVPTTVGKIGRFMAAGALAWLVAACGGGGGSPGTTTSGDGGNNGNRGVDSIVLMFGSTELKSAGTAGNEITVTALVKNANNGAVADAPMVFTASSGILTEMQATSDPNGRATALLGTGGDRTNRTITVTAKSGTKSASGTINVVGTTILATGPANISAGSTGEFSYTVQDSANAPVANVPVTVSSANGNQITVLTSNGGSATAPLTNAQGQVVISVAVSQPGTDTLTAAAQGVSVRSVVEVKSTKVSVDVMNAARQPVATALTTSACETIVASYEIEGVPQSGTVNISASRGEVYSDSSCTQILPSSSVQLINGVSQPAYLRSYTAGISTVTASISNGPSARRSLEFVAQLTPFATIDLQAEPAILSANMVSSEQEKSALTAIVRDGTEYNNPVKDAIVEFSILKDVSGGTLSNPSVTRTGSNGAANAFFFAGTATTPQNGVEIQARIQGTSTVAVTTLTVAKKSLFVSAGTGNKIESPTPTTYKQDYVVFVTDSGGNPVSGVAVTATLFPTHYAKGWLEYDPNAKKWGVVVPIENICDNEDIDQDGILDVGEDYNDNNKLDPGIPASVTSSGTTDASGTAIISILYPKDRANWTAVRLTVRAQVAGTESTYQVAPYWLPVLASDISDANTTPPGQFSPYGVNPCEIRD
jgi:hypothetical protein